MATAALTVTVIPVNDPPVATDDTRSTPEDTPLFIDVLGNDTDAESDPLVVTEINGQPINVGAPRVVTNGVVFLQNNGQLMFIASQNYTGPVSFSYTISDGNGGTDTADVLIDVTPVNDAPAAIDDSTSTAEDTPVVVDLIGNDTDIDGDTLVTAAINGTPLFVGSPVVVTNGTLTTDINGVVTFTPDPDYSGPVNFDYTVIDGNGGSDTAQVTITVTPVNDAPVAVNDSQTTLEDTAVSINVLTNDSDIDGDTLSITQVDGQAIVAGSSVTVSNGTVELQINGELLFTPDEDFNGNTTFDYTISDGNGESDTAIRPLCLMYWATIATWTATRSPSVKSTAPLLPLATL